MSLLTQFIRHIPVIGNATMDVLDAVTGNVTPIVAPAVHQAETVAIHDIGALFSASAVSILGKTLGPAATVPEHLVAAGISDFEAWLIAHLPAPPS